MKLKLAYYGNPILRKKCARIQEITEEIKTLIQDMIETMRACNGAGIAAPQVHHDKALFIICPLLEIRKVNGGQEKFKFHQP